MKLIKNWILPVIIATGIFLIIRPVMAQTQGDLRDVSVGVESVDGYSQIYYMDGDKRVFITSGNINSKMPVSAGSFIAYVSDINDQGQIFIYDLKSGNRTQITFTGTNLNPKVNDKGEILWEGWRYDSWQIFYFDSTSVRQMTTGDTSLNPDFSGDYISYSRRNSAGTWRGVIYSKKDDKSVDITTGENTKRIQIRNGEIYLGVGSANEEKFALKVDDLFILNLPTLNEATSSGDLIVDELSASPSGVIEVPVATESATNI